MKVNHIIRSKALIYPYSKQGKGGTSINAFDLVEKFRPLKMNDCLNAAEVAKRGILN